MGGGVLSENPLLTFDRYIIWNVPVSIKLPNPNLPVFLLCEIIQSTHKLIYFVKMKKVNKQCLLDTPRTERVSDKTWQVIVRTRRP